MQLEFISSAEALNLSAKCLWLGLGLHAGVVTDKTPGWFPNSVDLVVSAEPGIIKSVSSQYSTEAKAIWMSLGPKLICALYSLVIWEAIFHNTVRDAPSYIWDNLAQCSFEKITVLIAALQLQNNRPSWEDTEAAESDSPICLSGSISIKAVGISPRPGAVWDCTAGSEMWRELVNSS